MAKFINVTKQIFFDRDRIVRAMDAKTKKVLSSTGAFARTVMRRGMRKRKKISQPGEYPSAHEGSLRRLVYFGYDEPTQSLVVGPTLFRSKVGVGIGTASTVPELVNYGGLVFRQTTRALHRKGKRVIVSGGVQKHFYRPRPFVGLTFPKAVAKLRENMASVPFK